MNYTSLFSLLLLGGLFASPALAMNTGRNGRKIHARQRKELTKSTEPNFESRALDRHIVEDLEALLGSVRLPEVFAIFEEFESSRLLDDTIQDKLQDLKNYTCVLVEDDEALKFSQTPLCKEFTQGLITIMRLCCNSASLKSFPDLGSSHNSESIPAIAELSQKIDQLCAMATDFLKIRSYAFVHRVEDAYYSYMNYDNLYKECLATHSCKKYRDLYQQFLNNEFTDSTDTYLDALFHLEWLFDYCDQALSIWKEAEALVREKKQLVNLCIQKKQKIQRRSNSTKKQQALVTIENQLASKKDQRRKAVTKAKEARESHEALCYELERAKKVLLDLAKVDKDAAKQTLTSELAAYTKRLVYCNQACQKIPGLQRISHECTFSLFTTFEHDTTMKELFRRAQEAFKGALYESFMETLLNYCAYAYQPQTRNRAQGYRWEIEVGLCLFNCKEDSLQTLSTHLSHKLKDRNREFDATTRTCALECKNINWSRCNTGRRNKCYKQFEDQQAIAQLHGKTYAIISKHAFTAEIRRWLRRNHIQFIDPKNMSYDKLGTNLQELYQ